MFNILFYFPSVRPVCDRRDYFSAPEGGKEQPDKAERRNTLAADGWEEDLSGSPPVAACRHCQDWDGRVFSQQNNPTKVARLNDGIQGKRGLESTYKGC